MTRSSGTKVHTGFDWKADEGTNFYAPADITITAFATKQGGPGVYMDLGNGASVQVQHLQEYVDLNEGETKKVSVGTLVAKTGVTGNSADSGREPHGHVVTKINNGYADPRAFFSTENRVPYAISNGIGGTGL